MVHARCWFAVPPDRRQCAKESNMLNADDLALLEAIRSTGSLSRAAAQLGKAPSTVSHAARQLEARFDALLFDRRRYRLQLTPAGSLLANEAARIGEDMSRLTRRVKQVAGGWEDRLWIVTDEILEFEILLPLIRAFDELKSGVSLRITHEVLGGTWEALQEGRADLVVGATNEPPTIRDLQWVELGGMEWVFAVSPHHPLAAATQPVTGEVLAEHRAVVVGDSSRHALSRSYGIVGGQPTLAVPSMRAKVLAQREGLGVGWLPVHRIGGLLERGELVVKQVDKQREPNTLYAAWRTAQPGRALQWWLGQLRQPALATRLLQGLDIRG
jgi:DNA-binding transcriptional LysR family regulator